MNSNTELIIELREQGYTYDEIAVITGLSKGNISYVCTKHVVNNDDITQVNAAKNRNISGLSKSANYYESLREERLLYWFNKLLELPPTRVLYIAGLYNGEGNHHGTEFSFTNSDHKLIRDFTSFLDSVGAEYTAELYLHETHDTELALKYWALHTVLGGPEFKVRQYDSRPQKKPNKHRENHGTARIRTIKPLGLRDALAKYQESIKETW